MRGLGNFNLREALWAKQYWKASDEQADQKLYFEDVEKLCRRLNVNSSRDDLSRYFKACARFFLESYTAMTHELAQQADVKNRNFLDFDDFKRFVKLLKARPEVKRLYKKLCAHDKGCFSYQTFERFMREHQKVSGPASTQLLRMSLTFSRQVGCRRG
jgi:phosphatidylinositol phospholipase C delta